MDKMREKHVAEINKLKAIIEASESPTLVRDLSKKLKKMNKELNDYDRFKAGQRVCKR